MIRTAEIEPSQITDPATGKIIRISTTTRLAYRYIYRSEPDIPYMRNDKLNEMIARDYIDSAEKVVHHFKLRDGNVGEIRNRKGTVRFFISKISNEGVDILTLQNAWLSPKYTEKHGLKRPKAL